MNEQEEKIRSLAIRRAWAQRKFGQCSGKPEGCEQGITREDLRPLQVTWYIPGLGRTTSLDIFGTSSKKKKEPKKTPQRNARIKCRHCRGHHLTMKCPNRSGTITTVAPVSKTEKTTPQSYYLGPPPGIESNPLDFDFCEGEQHQLDPEEISATVQSYAQENQPVEEVTELLNQFLNSHHPQSARRGSPSHASTYKAPAAPPRIPPPVISRKWNNSRRGVEKYAKEDRWDFRKRKTPPPGSSGV